MGGPWPGLPRVGGGLCPPHPMPPPVGQGGLPKLLIGVQKGGCGGAAAAAPELRVSGGVGLCWEEGGGHGKGLWCVGQGCPGWTGLAAEVPYRCPPQEGLLGPPRLHSVWGEVLVLGGGAGAPRQLRVGGIAGQQQGKAWAEREGQGLSPVGRYRGVAGTGGGGLGGTWLVFVQGLWQEDAVTGFIPL